jgi:hypothetical protein
MTLFTSIPYISLPLTLIASVSVIHLLLQATSTLLKRGPDVSPTMQKKRGVAHVCGVRGWEEITIIQSILCTSAWAFPESVILFKLCILGFSYYLIVHDFATTCLVPSRRVHTVSGLCSFLVSWLEGILLATRSLVAPAKAKVYVVHRNWEWRPAFFGWAWFVRFGWVTRWTGGKYPPGWLSEFSFSLDWGLPILFLLSNKNYTLAKSLAERKRRTFFLPVYRYTIQYEMSIHFLHHSKDFCTRLCRREYLCCERAN